MNPQAGAAGNFSVAARDEALEAGGRERVPEDLLDDIAAEGFVAGWAVEGVGVKKARGDGIHPGPGVVGACPLDRDGRADGVFHRFDVERKPKYVLEADELVAAPAQHARDDG